jgi:hypothetical protein
LITLGVVDMKTIKAAGLLAVVSGAVVAAIACSEHTEPVESVERPVSQLRQSLVDVPSNNGVSALAGTGVRGALDASNALSGTFNDPAGVSIATDGTVYVAEWGNNSIRRIQTSGALDTAILGNPNLLTNPRCEEAGTLISTNWLWSGSATWLCSTSDYDGKAFTVDGINETSQIVDLAAYSSIISANHGGLVLSGVARRTGNGSVAMGIAALNQSNQTVASISTAPSQNGAWHRQSAILALPTTTKKVRVTLWVEGRFLMTSMVVDSIRSS